MATVGWSVPGRSSATAAIARPGIGNSPPSIRKMTSKNKTAANGAMSNGLRSSRE